MWTSRPPYVEKSEGDPVSEMSSLGLGIAVSQGVFKMDVLSDSTPLPLELRIVFHSTHGGQLKEPLLKLKMLQILSIPSSIRLGAVRAPIP